MNNKGQSLVLFILILPILLGIMVLVIDVGNAIYTKNKINNITIIKLNKEDYNPNYNGNNICRLDSSKLAFPLYIRNRKEGDYIETLSLNGKKKIKEIFIEHKIPKHLRASYPILVDNNDNIIWLPNLKKSKFNSQSNEFYDIILKYCEKEENDE